MKLQNKDTGEIGIPRVEYQEFYIDTENGYTYNYNSLHRMYEEWEDMSEEPGLLYVIDPDRLNCINKIYKAYAPSQYDRAIGMGLGFEKLEEAEKAVECLRAWKRLEDKGFRFIEWELDMKTIADGKIWFDVGVNTQWDAEHLLECEPEVKKSLDLLFGGEE